MHINITKRVINAMNDDDLSIIRRTHRNIYGMDNLLIDLADMDETACVELCGVFERLRDGGVPNMGPLINDINRWLDISVYGADGKERARHMQQFSDLLGQYILNSPGFRIYEQQVRPDEWLCYYANYVHYHPEVKDRDWYQPAYTSLHLLYYRLGTLLGATRDFRHDDVDGKTIAQAFAGKGLVLETEDLRSPVSGYHGPV